MGSPFLCIDIICKCIYGLSKTVVVLKGYFYDCAVSFSVKINRLWMNRCLIFIQVFNKRYDTAAIMKFLLFEMIKVKVVPYLVSSSFETFLRCLQRGWILLRFQRFVFVYFLRNPNPVWDLAC